MARTLSCAESEELLALAALQLLSRGEGAPLDEHLSECAACRRAAQRFREGTIMLRDSLEVAAPPASTRRYLMRIAYGETVQAPPTRRSVRVRWPTSRVRVVALASAAAMTALTIAVAAVVPKGEGATRTYTVIGTTIAPAVTGTLTYSREQQQAVMTVSWLPNPVSIAGIPPQVYEVWLVRANGSAEGVGFLERAPTASSWSTVIDADLSRFVTVAATAEPFGGSPQPTGPQLLSVELTQ